MKKRSQEWFRKKCVVLAKIEAKKLVNYRCEHCGRTRDKGWQMHGSHIKPEGTYKSMSADVDNILCLCARCHTGGMWKNSKEPSWHTDPLYMAEWFNKKYPGRYLMLTKRAQNIQVVNWEKKYAEMKSIKAQFY